MNDVQKPVLFRRIWTVLVIGFLFSASVVSPAQATENGSPEGVFRNHGSYPIEWWYLTGRIRVPGHPRRDGFEGTFFRFNTSWQHPAGRPPSPWEPSRVLSFHGAYSDTLHHRFRSTELLSRTFRRAVSLRKKPFRIRFGENFLEVLPDPGHSGEIRLHLFEQVGWRLVDVTLKGKGSPLEEGPGGRLVTGPGPGDWAWYLSYPELSLKGKVGRIQSDGQVHWTPVTGVAWFDHEWTGALLGKGQTGWIWLGARLSGKGDLMAFQMQKKDRPDRFQGGTYRMTVHSGNRTVWLSPSDLTFHVLSYWKSPRTGICYPSRLKLDVKSLNTSWRIDPVMKDQELTGRPDYWEGAVSLRDSASGEREGEGYLELTGFPVSKGPCP